jgi:hypothetical protein
MDYGKVLGRAWEITWRWKILWILGFLASLGSGGGGGGSPNAYTGSGEDFNIDQWTGGGWPVGEFLPAVSGIIGIIIVVVCVLFIIAIALWVVSVIARGGLIAGVQQVEDQGSTLWIGHFSCNPDDHPDICFDYPVWFGNRGCGGYFGYLGDRGHRWHSNDLIVVRRFFMLWDDYSGDRLGADPCLRRAGGHPGGFRLDRGLQTRLAGAEGEPWSYYYILVYLLGDRNRDFWDIFRDYRCIGCAVSAAPAALRRSGNLVDRAGLLCWACNGDSVCID